jgi:hypothetical protein
LDRFRNGRGGRRQCQLRAAHLRAHGLQPHRVRQFKLSNDPAFVEKLRNIVGLYVDPPAHAVVRGEFRRDAALPILLSEDVFVKGIRKGVEQGEYVYQRGDLLYGPATLRPRRPDHSDRRRRAGRGFHHGLRQGSQYLAAHRTQTNRRRSWNGSYAGLTSTPYSSGGINREQGIGKAGNRRLRTVMVELAWLWQRYQPGAAQVAWFRDRVGSTGRRIRKVMVVALARKLLIALWRFVIDGVMPEGAVMKPSI